MKLNLKARFLELFAVTLRVAFPIGIVVSAGILSACTNTQNQAQAPNSTVTEASGSGQTTDDSHMNHGNMDHGNTNHGSSMDHSMEMNLGPADAEYDLRFIDAMTPHHQGAIEMAKEVQQKSKRSEMQKLANDIIKAQDKEIAQMKQWRAAWYPTASAQPVTYDPKTEKSMPMSPDQMKSMMMNMNLGTADAEFDLRFMNAMIPHHEGAVTMAKDALSKSKRPEVKQLAQDIIRSQAAEIKQMQQWKQAWYGK